ncbi:MAG: cell division protein FtsX [Bacteriovoracia bacterium]
MNFKRIVRSGFVNFWRNGIVSLSAILVMVVTLFIISSVIFGGALLEHTLEELKDRVDVNVNISTDVIEDDVLALKTQIENLPEVAEVEYVSSEEALERYRERHADDQKILAALDELEGNPLGAVLNIKAKDTSQYESIQLFLEENYPEGQTDSIIENVNYARKEAAINSLNLIISTGEKFGTLLTAIFVILSVIITLNTIRLAMYISRDEIKVMNLVGANHSYISGPFIVTGCIYGIVSAIFVLILLYPITFYIGPQIAPIFFDLNLFSYYVSNFGQLFLILFVAGIVIGAISSLLAVNRYLKKRK